MKIDIQSFATNLSNAKNTVVIIDVFRAFSVAAYALDNGAEQIIMVDDVDQAIDLRKRNIGQICLGERGGIKPQDFDYGNSPVDLIDQDFTGKTLIQTTSNGTRGLYAAKGANELFVASFLTAKATTDIINESAPVTLVAMGEADSKKCEEDELCAFYMRALLEQRQPTKGPIMDAIRTLSSRVDGQRLSEQDIDHCLQPDLFSFAIKIHLESDTLIAYKVEI